MRTRSAIMMSLLWLLAGCAVQAFVEEEAGVEAGVDDFSLPPPPPPVGGAGGVGGMGGMGGVGGMGGAGGAGGMMGPGGGGGDCGGQPATCTPGQRVGLCEVCNACGQPDLAEDDDECPQLNCRNRATYQLEGDRCVIIRPMLTAGRCLGPGSCRDPDDATACGETQRNTIQTLNEECTAFEGCEGQVGPEIVAAPNGTPCGPDGMGLCRGGACDLEVGEECMAFGGQTCEIGVHTDGNDFCQVAVEGANHCVEVCVNGGGVCLLAWSGPDGCVTAQEIGCLDPAPRLICRCSRE